MHREIDVMEHYEKSRTRLLDIWKEFGILEADVNARKIVSVFNHVRADSLKHLKPLLYGLETLPG